VSSPEPWQPAFLAVSVLVGEPLEAALGAIGGEGASQATGAILRDLRSTSKQMRVRAIARVATAIVTGFDEAAAP
jgi:hypothetical protein